MNAPTAAKQDSGKRAQWIIGTASSHPLGRLWERYLSITCPPGEHASFSGFRVKTLGAASEEGTDREVGTIVPQLITRLDTLSAIEANLKHQDGRPLQRIVRDDISSRVLTEIAVRVPGASSLTEQAIGLLKDLCPHYAAQLSTRIAWIVPIYHERYGRSFRRGFSHVDYLGVIFTSYVERFALAEEIRAIVLAVDLAHELGHQALMLYQLSDPIFESPQDAPVYSSVRKTERPAVLALHASVAAAYMMDVCTSALRSSATCGAEKTFALLSLRELREHQVIGLKALRTTSRFTAIGERIISELEAQLNTNELWQENESASISLAEVSRGSQPSYFGLLEP